MVWGRLVPYPKEELLAFCARILSKFSLLRNIVKVGVMLVDAILQLLGGSKMLFIFSVSDLAA